MTITVRTAAMSDLPTLKVFEQGIITAERPYDASIKPDPVSYYDIGELIASPDCEVAVAEAEGELIASGYALRKKSRIYVKSDEHAYIGFLYVDSAFRGQGVNKLVLGHLFDWARENGLPDVHLTVYPENAPAVQAYKKAGFRPHMLEMRMELD